MPVEAATALGAALPPAWEAVRLARHPERPPASHYLRTTFRGFLELHGDRLYRDDPAIVGGTAWLGCQPLVVIAHEKGVDFAEREARCFGMPHPEGYRKAYRLMHLAARFRLPLVSLLDTPGAYPGLGAEARGQAQAIAANLEFMARLPVPIVSVVIGEGGSGGALALGLADRLLMLEHAVYSVISPEGCAAILWREPGAAPQAAAALRLTAAELFRFGLADEVIPEPGGGAHLAPTATARAVRDALRRHLAHLGGLPVPQLVRRRWQRYRAVGRCVEPRAAAGRGSIRAEGA